MRQRFPNPWNIPAIMPPSQTPSDTKISRRAYRFVLLIGVLSLFADFTYEGARSILGPYLASLQASAAIVGTVTGFGELAGYALRLFSGRLADATRQFWPISIAGYLLQMTAVPALALTHNWQSAAVLIILERIGKAVRNPPRDVMLSYAAQEVGRYGWVFGIHESLDQMGALAGPLLVAMVLARHGSYREAFAVLALPALINLCFVMLAWRLYPRPEALAVRRPANDAPDGLPRLFWVYLLGAGLIAAGFADYPLIAFHFSRAHTVPNEWIAAFYAVAMAVSGAGSLLFGHLFDRYGFRVLIGLSLFSLLFAPLVFEGSFWMALAGSAIWGLGMGVHESIIPAAVAPMVAVDRRASAFGLFTAGYGVFWFAGSALMGVLYDRSVWATVVFCIAMQFAAIPIFIWIDKQTPKAP